MTREQEFIHELLTYCSHIESECCRENYNFARKIKNNDHVIMTNFGINIDSICNKYSDVYNKLLIDYNNDVVSDDYKIADFYNSNNIELGIISNIKTCIIPPKCKPSR